MAQETTADAPITLPGAIPGLLRRCSPVVVSVRDQPIQRGVVGQLYPPMLFGVWVHGEPSQAGRTRYGTAEAINQKWLALDLTHETGRWHARRWLVPRALDEHGQRHCEQGVIWHPPVRIARTDLGDPFKTPRRWVLYGWTSMDGVAFVPAMDGHDSWGDGYRHVVVPALADLDPDEPTLLPDGSRRVDALALQAACLHVGGAR